MRSGKQSNRSFIEFVVIISLMMSITALSIDAMLPALPDIGTELEVINPNQRQLVVSLIFLGLAIGQLFFGPLSDKTGRKPAVLAGYALYICGALISALAGTFNILLLGRVLQGLGASAPRSITMAVVRDKYEGRKMAQVMSFNMTVFILVPMLAPSLGQFVMGFAGWRGIFYAFIILAVLTGAWFTLRIPETLPVEKRSPFTIGRIINATGEIVRNKTAISYTVSAGLIGGAFLGYLNSSQQVFQEQYGLGDKFPLVFALISFSIGLASLLNSQLVMRFGMRSLVDWSLRVIVFLAVVGLIVSSFFGGLPPLPVTIGYFLLTFFSIGILFGNQNSIAMQPLGHLAGIGAAIVGSLSTLIQMPLGTIIGQSYNETIQPLMIGIGVLSCLSIIVIRVWNKDEKVMERNNA